MKTHILILGIIGIVVLSACSTGLNSAQQPTVTNFEECVQAGNPVMESYPRQCRHGDNTFTEVIEQISNDKKPCTREYRPVCGKIQVQCIKAPCPPLDTTFPNRCEAENAKATDIREGECQDETPSFEGACLSFDGNWISDTQECEGMSKDQCEKLGGAFNECASACRNDPDAEICTLQCVLVCKF